MEIDITISEFLDNVTDDFNTGNIHTVLRAVDDMVNISILTNGFNSIKLETELIDIILNEEISKEDKLILVKQHITKEILNLLTTSGIRLNEEITISELGSILDSLNTVFTLDEDQKHQIDSILSEEDSELRLMVTNIISEYSDLDISNIYNLIEEIDITFIETIKENVKIEEVSILEEDTEESVMNKIKKLLDIDPMYLSTYIVGKYALGHYGGYTAEDNVDELYFNLNRQDDLSMIVLELSAFLILSNSNSEELLENYEDVINLEHVQSLESDLIMQSKVMNIAKEQYISYLRS